MIRKGDEARPDRLKATLQKVARLDRENRSPHHGDESSNADGRERPIHAKDASDDDGERYIVCGTHLASECDHNAANGKAEEDDRDRLSRCETQSHDTAHG